jgi:putative redox protein
MDVISIRKNRGQPAEYSEVQMHEERAVEHSRVFTYLKVKVLFDGRGIETAAVARAIELSKTTYRMAEAMLSPSARIELPFEIVEVAWPTKVGGG